MLAESFGDLSFRFRRRDPNRGCLQAIGAPFFALGHSKGLIWRKLQSSCAASTLP